MSKKIIAVSCVLIMLVLVITACQKKPATTEINGEQYVLVTDAEGNTMLTSDGFIRAYVLDDKGYPVTNTDGSYAEKLVTVANDVIVGDKTISTAEYALTMPKGWLPGDAGIFTKVGTDNKCTIRMGFADELKEISYAEFVQNDISQNQLFAQTYQQQNPDNEITMDVKDITIVHGNVNATSRTYMIKDPSGKVIHYAVMIFYPYNDQAYFINLACPEGAGYDEDFDFLTYIAENYVIK